MFDTSQQSVTQTEIGFVKGMSLEDYMARISVGNITCTSEKGDESEQNLYESCLQKIEIGSDGRKNHYLIEEIDEESAEDSIQYCQDEFNKDQQKLITKETLRQNNQTPDFTLRQKINSISMNATAYLKHTSRQKPNFRLKQVSVSPYHRKSDTIGQNGSITLYGSKFGQSVGKSSNKMPQLVTFYGKIHHNQQKEEQILRSNAAKKSDSKRNFKKKNHLQINELIEFQKKIKNTYSHKAQYSDIKIQGIRDKLAERKSKLC